MNAIPPVGRQHRVGGDVVGERAVETERGDGERRRDADAAAAISRDVEASCQHGVGREQHVGMVEQGVEPLAVGVGGEVEHHTELPCVADRPGERDPRTNRSEVARRRPARRLHLHHDGSQIGEVAAAELAPLDGAVDDAEPGEGQWTVSHRPHSLQHGGAPVEP